MQKSARLIALVTVLSFAGVPSLRAETLGTNPHPWAGKGVAAAVSSIVYNVRSYFGL